MRRRIFKSRWAWGCTFTWEDGYSRTLYAGSFDAAVRLAGTNPKRTQEHPQQISVKALPEVPSHIDFYGFPIPREVFGPPPGHEWYGLDALQKRYIN
mgnify:CR=1 FL=1